MNRTPEDLEVRLSRLERQNRQYRVVTAVIVALSIVPLFTTTAGVQGPATTDVVRTQRLEIVRNDKVVAFLDTTDNGGRLYVNDSDGQVVASLGARKEGATNFGQLCLSTPSQSNCALIARAFTGNNGQLYLYTGKTATASLFADLSGGNLQLDEFAKVVGKPPIELNAGAYLATVRGFRGSAQLGDLGVLLLDKDGNRRPGQRQ